MDTFIEIMVRKNKTIRDFALMAVYSVLASILVFIMFFIVLPIFNAFASIIFLVIVGIVYGAFKLIKSFNVEYEYALVNTEVDIDKIIDQKRRKRLTSFSISTLENFGRCKNSRVLDGYMKDAGIKKVMACSAREDEGVYYALYTEKEKRTVVLFNPGDKIVEAVKKRNPLKVREFEL